MKRLVLVFFVLATINSAASAEGFSYGAKGGYFTACITTVPAGWTDTAFRDGFAAGAFLNYEFNENLSLQTELLYIVKGLKGIISNPLLKLEFTGRYDYIEMPILAKYTMPAGGGFGFCFFLGPSFGINLTADINVEGRNFYTQESMSGSIDYSNATETIEFGTILGTGCSLDIFGGQLIFDARFHLGLSRIVKGGEVTGEIDGEEYRELVEEDDTKNLGFALLLGFAF